MNCCNCGSRLFLFNETEELYPGSDLVFCTSCHRKINAFLEDENKFTTNQEHLSSWQNSLISGGVRPGGMKALSAYVNYLDRLAPRQNPVTQDLSTITVERVPQKVVQTLQVVPAKEINQQLEDSRKQVLEMTTTVKKFHKALKWMVFATITSALMGIASFVAVLFTIL